MNYYLMNNNKVMELLYGEYDLYLLILEFVIPLRPEILINN